MDKENLSKSEKTSKIFSTLSENTAEFIGNKWTFLFVVLLTFTWILFGAIFGFSDKWFMLLHSTIGIITLLIVFVIQNTENRHAKSMHIKLNELIRVHELANNSIIDLHKLSDKQLKEVEEYYKKIISHKSDVPSE